MNLPKAPNVSYQTSRMITFINKRFSSDSMAVSMRLVGCNLIAPRETPREAQIFNPAALVSIWVQ
jgi:hypothetical protein